MDFTPIRSLAEEIGAECGKVIIGKGEQIRLVLTSLFAGGHVLIDDIPGVGKTTLVKALAAVLGCGMVRVQFTPDLLPSDIVGMNIYHQKTGEMVFSPGPVMTNILLADEINRAIPRTQSALLEAMEERQVSVDGVTYPLAPPFIVLATQNPVETETTVPLPAAQLDRFLFKLSMGYPTEAEETAMLRAVGDGASFQGLRPLLSPERDQRHRRRGPPGAPRGPGGDLHRGAGPGHPGTAGSGLRRQPPGLPGPVPGLQGLRRPRRPGFCHPG